MCYVQRTYVVVHYECIHCRCYWHRMRKKMRSAATDNARNSPGTGYLIHFMRIYGNFMEQCDGSSNALDRMKSKKSKQGNQCRRALALYAIHFPNTEKDKAEPGSFQLISLMPFITLSFALPPVRWLCSVPFLHSLRCILPKIKNQCLRVIDRIAQ